MAHVAACIVRGYLKREIADWQWAKQIGGNPGDVGQPVIPRRMFNAATRQRDRWASVLVMGVP